MTPRRTFLAALASAAAFTGVHPATRAAEAPAGPRRRRPIGVSTYSWWRFTHADYRPVERCLELAVEAGFDGVEILQRQLTDTQPAALRTIKRRAQALGLPLMGYSTHQGFVSPQADKRDLNVRLTVDYLEQAYQLGIPTIRVNTGGWGTSKNFDELMARRGIEPRLEGHTEDEAFQWVIDAFNRLVPEAEKRGIVMGLENHWGLGVTPEGVLRVVNAVNSPWLRVTLDTGNFLEDPYAKLAQLAPQTVLLQAKTYFGGGQWYTLDLDYARIAGLMQAAGYQGWVSLEYEGRDEVVGGVKRSLALLREHF